MVASIKKRVSMLVAMMAMAMIAALMTAGLAYADTTVQVKFANPNSAASATLPEYTASVNLTNLAGSATCDNNVPYFAQFYKNGAWTVLATPADAYVPVKEVLENALAQYNTQYSTSYLLGDIWGSNNEIQLYSNNEEYNKNYPDYSSVMNSTYFYNKIVSGVGAFSNSYRDSSWSIVVDNSTLTVDNPEQGAVIALTYYKAVGTSSDTTTMASALAESALGSTAESDAPRILVGGNDGGSVAGNRFCFQLTGLEII